MLHSNIRVTENSVIHGKGLVAAEVIRRGEIVWKRNAGERVVDLAEVQTWSEAEKEDFFWLAYQCGETQFVVPSGNDGYMNHSCNPNVWWLDDHTMFAARDIQIGEEATYDYATSDVLLPFEMECRCGSPLCRGVVRNTDHLNVEWQRKYSTFLPSYTKKAIERAKAGIDALFR